MRKIIQICFLLLVTAFTGNKLHAQVDPHFSQYYVYPAWLNPALTGVFDGQFRAAAIYRSQWGNVSSPFTTPGVSLDFATESNINFGGSIIKQQAAGGGFNYTTAYGNAAYTGVRFGPQQFKRVVIGIQAGLIQRRFDPTKMTFGDQWNPVTGFNSGTQTADLFNRTSASSFDAGAGVLYFDAQPGKKANFFGGFSASHINRPDDQFSASGEARLPVRYTLHSGMRFTLSEVFSLTPNILFLKQGTAREQMIGAYAQYKAGEETELLLGANYRMNDAISPFAGFTFKNMVLGLSYDVNSSDLSRMAKGANSFEISLSFIGKKVTRTPEAEFVCPRL